MKCHPKVLELPDIHIAATSPTLPLRRTLYVTHEQFVFCTSFARKRLQPSPSQTSIIEPSFQCMTLSAWCAFQLHFCSGTVLTLSFLSQVVFDLRDFNITCINFFTKLHLIFLRSPKAFTGYCVWAPQVITDLWKLREGDRYWSVSIAFSHKNSSAESLYSSGRYRPVQGNRFIRNFTV